MRTMPTRATSLGKTQCYARSALSHLCNRNTLHPSKFSLLVFGARILELFHWGIQRIVNFRHSCTIFCVNGPLVSIILRSFNEGWALRETLPALLQQEYNNWELIVIDSGSTDGSVDLIRSAQPAHFVQIAPHEYNPA